jgi:hypothetical protein
LEYSDKTFLLLKFPEDKRKIAKLSSEEKMEWYAHQFQRTPGLYPYELTTTDFETFWRWHVLIPMKIKRFFYRIKNRQIFKRYPHITEIKKKLKDRAHLI